MAARKELEFEIVKHHGVIAEKTKGWKKELNSVSWAGAEPKYDIRDWSPEHDKMGKGITLTENEMRAVYALLDELFNEDSISTEIINGLAGIDLD